MTIRISFTLQVIDKVRLHKLTQQITRMLKFYLESEGITATVEVQ